MHDAFQITEVGLQARNLVLVKYPAHTFYGILAGRSPYNQLAYHRVVIDGNLVTFVNVAVNAYADAVRLRQLFDDTRRRHEVVLRVFRTDTTFDGMTALEKFFLLQVQHLVIGYTVYLEKFVEEPHHIEFQILGDNHGNVIHLFDRECSVQRRNQKIVEESPSPFLTPELRQEMGEKAVAAARAVNYSGAGTIEFLVDKNRNFYFLEMNTRLQVEHPITEEVVGVDLVKEQIRIANDEVLHLKQEELYQRGHAIECRICAEDTENNFMPSPGIIKQLTEPNGIGVRIDSYVYEGYEIPVFYDPMIGKLIVWATTRQYAIERMRRVLYEYKITGLKTNLSYLKRIMHTPDFVKGEYNTLFIEKNSRQRLMGRASDSWGLLFSSRFII